MKLRCIVTLCSCFILHSSIAENIAVWNFNSPVPDGSTSTGSTVPAFGSGTASLLGGVSQSFTSGTGGCDPDSADDSAMSTGSYPSATVGNKTAGARFDVSTSGYTNVLVSWCQKNSNTASRYARFQYTTNGTYFWDLVALATTSDNFTNHAVDLSGVPNIANNPLFGFRIVTEFEYTVLNQGFQGYVATGTGDYGTAGTIRFDMVTVAGTPLPGGNTPPVISSLVPQTVRVRQTCAAQPFTILDGETPAANLALSASSSSPAVVPEANIVFGGSGRDRTVAVTGGDTSGSSIITVTVTDPGGKSSTAGFTVTVLPANTAPVVSAIPATNTLAGHALGPVLFTVQDAETPAALLTVSATSDAPQLFEPANLIHGGNATNRNLMLTPRAGETGVAPIRIRVSDGTNAAETSFAVMVRPTTEVLFLDSFNYPDGSLLTNSAFLWENRSGTDGQCRITNGAIWLAGAQGEDVGGRLVGGPFSPGSNVTLYASFMMRALGLPKTMPGLFAHFADGTTTRGRILAGLTNASPGCFRLFVSNATETNLPASLPVDLATNITYRVVLRYDLDGPQARIWVNPTAETDPSAMAADTPNPGKVTLFGFRQDADVGATFLIDDLRVGLTFASVSTNTVGPPKPPVLGWIRSMSGLTLTWAEDAVLQTASSPAGPYSDVSNATSPRVVGAGQGTAFFRLRSK